MPLLGGVHFLEHAQGNSGQITGRDSVQLVQQNHWKPINRLKNQKKDHGQRTGTLWQTITSVGRDGNVGQLSVRKQFYECTVCLSSGSRIQVKVCFLYWADDHLAARKLPSFSETAGLGFHLPPKKELRGLLTLTFWLMTMTGGQFLLYRLTLGST